MSDEKNCYGCRFSGMEPDDHRLICFNKQAGAGGYGKYISGPVTLETVLVACGPELKLWEQHPQRGPKGELNLPPKEVKAVFNVPVDRKAQDAVKRLLAMPNGQELAQIYLEGWYDRENAK